MTKLLENIYRCVNIALVNELKLLSLRMGLDIWEVIEAASPSLSGFSRSIPGPGLGGHCIPVDPFYLSWKAKEWDFRTRFIELAGEINIGMPYHVLDYVAKALNQQKKALNGAKVLVLGLAYKKDIDDLRESPSLTIIELLQEQGADVSYNDPYFPTVGKGRKYDLQMKCAPLDNLGQYDCVLIVTDHSDYDYQRIVRESQLVVDTRNATEASRAPKSCTARSGLELRNRCFPRETDRAAFPATIFTARSVQNLSCPGSAFDTLFIHSAAEPQPNTSAAFSCQCSASALAADILLQSPEIKVSRA